MASIGSEVFRIDSQEDEVIDSQRQDVEMSSQEELAIDKEINKEVRNSEKDVVITQDMMQILIMKMEKFESSIRESKEEMQNSLKEECRNIRIDNQINRERLGKRLEKRVKGTVMNQAEQQSSDLHESENKISQSTKKRKEVVKSIKLDDQGITERLEYKITRGEEIVQSTVMSQAEQHGPKLYERENRIPQSKEEESGQLKEHDNTIMNKEIDANETEGNEYLDVKLSEQNSQLDNKYTVVGHNKDSEQVVDGSMNLEVNKRARNAKVNINVNTEIERSGKQNKLWGVQRIISKSNYLLFSQMTVFKLRSEINDSTGDYSGEVEKFFEMEIAPEIHKMMKIKKSGPREQENWYDRYMSKLKVIGAKVRQRLIGKREDGNKTADIRGIVARKTYGCKKEEKQKCRIHRRKKKWNTAEGDVVLIGNHKSGVNEIRESKYSGQI